jgi:PIN domain nuclease of toxin-antitoxin system
MDATQAAFVQQAMGIQADKAVPPIPELLKQIVDGLKKLGDKGLSGARAHSTQMHLAGIVSMIKFELDQNSIADKITGNNLTQVQLDAAKEAANKTVTNAAGNTLGSLA